MASPGDYCVFEQALPPPFRTVQVSRDEVERLGISQSFIEATVRSGSLCGCTHLRNQDKLLCWELDPSARCLTVREVQLLPSYIRLNCPCGRLVKLIAYSGCFLVQVIANAEQQPEACQWVFTFELLPAVCSYTLDEKLTLVLFSQTGSLIKLTIDTSHPRGCLYAPRETTDRIQYPLSQAIPGTLSQIF